MVCLGAVSKMTERFKDRNIKATTDGMVTSVWQTTGCEHQFVPGPLCVQPEMLSLLDCEPREGSCVITSCTLVMAVDSAMIESDRRC